jgi:hypothetical protein
MTTGVVAAQRLGCAAGMRVILGLQDEVLSGRHA